MSAPWMPFYVADYLADTGHLSTIEHGAYLLLIMHYWRQGALPTDDKVLARIVRMNPREWQASRATLAEFFSDDWTHARIEKELEKSREKSSRRAEAGSRGGNAKALKNKDTSLANATILPEQKPADALASSSQPQPDRVSNETLKRAKKKPSVIADAQAVEILDRLRRVYPKRSGGDLREPAMKALSRALREGAIAAEVCEGAERYARSRKGQDPQFTKMLSTWLNAKGWQDDYGPPRKATDGMSAMAKMAMGIFDDEQPDDASEPTGPDYGPRASDARAIGFAGRLSQSDRDDAGGPCLDFGQGGAGWD